MPELPEVEGYRRYLETTALQQPIAEVTFENEGRMVPSGREALQATVLGRCFQQTTRIGKYLFVQLDEGPVLMLHFGMTGYLKYHQGDSPGPRFTRVSFLFENGYALAFASMRKFSRLKLTPSVADFQSANKLGPDALAISETDFVAALQGRKAYLKSALLQQQHFAGLGNWIADEMLFQARIPPESRCSDLPESTFGALYQAMQDILQMAIKYRARYEAFPQKYMVNERWKAGHCPRCQTELTRMVLGGRGTYFCPNCQG
jgi:formamidopyrimidine-DNA glycosylase